jgi:hypothetical protein
MSLLLDLPVNTPGLRGDSHLIHNEAIVLPVTVDELKDHLIVLRAFNKIHYAIHPDGVIVNDVTGLPVSTPSHFLFVSRAQHRFDLWTSRVLRSATRNTAAPLQILELPPPDVLMFIHAYMLTPWNFYEDCSRLYPELADERFPLSVIVSVDIN